MSLARLQLRPDAYIAQSRQKTVILTHQGTTLLAGRSVHRWIDRLKPYLDGRFTVADLTAHLDPERAEFVRALVATLVERGVVRERRGVQRDEDGVAKPESSSEVDFVGYFRESANQEVERYRNTVALVVGVNRLASAVVHALRVSGCRRVHTATDAAEATVAAADVVIDIRDLPPAARADKLPEWCARDRTVYCRAVLVNSEAWLAPAGTPAGGWRRLVVGSTPGKPGVPTDPGGAIVANQLVHDVFRFLTGLRSTSPAMLTRFDLDRLSTTTHTFVSHPFDAAVRTWDDTAFLQRIDEFHNGPCLDAEQFSRAARRLVDSRLGVFGEISEGNLAQLPVHVATATVSDPVGLLGADAPRPVVAGTGLDFATARYQTALSALATYGSLMIDPRRLISASGEALMAPDATPDDAPAWLRAAGGRAYVRALDLSDRRVVAVPVERVFPAVSGVDGGYVAPVGVAAGFTWVEAVTTGLLVHCRELTVADAMAADEPFPRVELPPRAGDPDVACYRAMLDAIGEQIALYDVTGSLGVPTVACCRGDHTVDYVSATSLDGALVQGMHTILLSYQSCANGQPVYHPPAVLDLPLALRGDRGDPVSPRAPLDAAALVSALARAEHRAVVVPLDHDDMVLDIAPYLCRVVLNAHS